jgi:hypothetical protein
VIIFAVASALCGLTPRGGAAEAWRAGGPMVIGPPACNQNPFGMKNKLSRTDSCSTLSRSRFD